jgi:dTDP-4-dehydrorhamnose reductase
VDYPEIDLGSPESLRKWVRQTSPSVVINAAAYTAVDKAEAEQELAQRINGIAPGILAEEAKSLGALLVHYSTDYVFAGDKSEPYLETDSPRPASAYGRSKLAGDLAVQSVGGAHLIFRLCWVYGDRGQNFMVTMMRQARQREKLRVVKDQIGCPTWSRMIAEATSVAITQALASSDGGKAVSGVYHLASAGVASWHEFAEAIVSLMPSEQKKCELVEAITTAEYPTPAKRPAYSALSCEKVERTFGLRLPHWRQGLELVMDKAA